MRLNELHKDGVRVAGEIKGVPERPNRSHPNSVEDYFYSLGYRNAGEGNFGQVFKKENQEIVVKRLMQADPAYKAFVEFTKKNKGNPHLPRIAGPYKIGINEKDYIYIIEKLQPLTIFGNESEPWGPDETEMWDRTKSKRSWDGAIVEDIMRMIHNFGLHKLSDITVDKSGTHKALYNMKNKYGTKKIKQVMKEYGPFLKTAMQIKREFQHEHLIDLFKRNVMLRPSTGDLVITDPIA